jgi:tetratricopeptide (TPR) repeat protein
MKTGHLVTIAALLVFTLAFHTSVCAQQTGPPTAREGSVPPSPQLLEKLKAEYAAGKKLFDEGWLAEAIDKWERVARYMPAYQSVQDQLVTAYKYLGIELYGANKLQEAVEVWSKAMALAPGNEEIADYFKRAESELRRIEVAEDDQVADSGKVVTKNRPKPKVPDTGSYDSNRQGIDLTSKALAAMNDSLTAMQARLAKLEAEIGGDEEGDVYTKSGADITLSGFVAAAAVVDHNSGETSFALDQVELDVEAHLDRRSFARVDLEYITDANGDLQADVEQGYAAYRFGSDLNWQVAFGKFNVPIGFEKIDPPEAYKYTSSLVFQYGRPVNMTGLLLTARLSDQLNWQVYIGNGWDLSTDINKDKTIGSRLGFAPTEQFKGGLSMITGAEQADNNSSRRTVWDLDLTFVPDKHLIVGGDITYGVETKALPDGSEGEWLGLMAMVSYLSDEGIGITGRLDYFDDSDGLRTSHVQRLKSMLVAPFIDLTDRLNAMFELRYDFSDENVFVDSDGAPEDFRIVSSVQLLYSF